MTAGVDVKIQTDKHKTCKLGGKAGKALNIYYFNFHIHKELDERTCPVS